jgi:Short C-terminal domain
MQHCDSIQSKPSRASATQFTRFTRVLCCAALFSVGLPSHAGWLDTLLGQNNSAAATAGDAKQRVWPLHEFTTIALVQREAGASANQHPATVPAEALRQQLALLQFSQGSARGPLFAADELAELAVPIAQALGRAGAGDDIVLLSSSKRDGGILSPPKAVTARLFVQGGALQFIAHDARFDFFDTYRATHNEPRFVFGMRSAASAAALQASGAWTQPRADWVAMPLTSIAAAPPAAAPASPAPATPAPAPPPGATMAPASPSPAAAPAPRKPVDAAGEQDIERRLDTLKRLRDKGVISDDEYQLKRKEILQLL